MTIASSEGNTTTEVESIKVLVRVRPRKENLTREPQSPVSSKTEHSGYDASCVEINEDSSISVQAPRGRKDQDRYYFKFDQVASPDVSQQTIFDMIGISSCNAFLDGFNAAVFAYGQTGSGKTYTMYGDMDDNEACGLVPRSLEYIFDAVDELRKNGSKINCKVSLIEIYNEQIFDLLPNQRENNQSLQIRESFPQGNVYVEYATNQAVSNAEETKALLRNGMVKRTIAATSANEYSSRSHCIFTLNLDVTETSGHRTSVRTSALHLVDLAGSERQKEAKTVGARLKEANNINKSLLALGNVILALSEGSKHVPFRDSKLTFLLRDSIGGNSKTAMIAAVSPHFSAQGETLSTLKFASFAKLSQLVAKRNVCNHDLSLAELKLEVRRLKQLLDADKTNALTASDFPTASRLLLPSSNDPSPADILSPTSSSASASAVIHPVDAASFRRLHALLRQSFDREEMLRGKLAGERARFRSRVDDYQKVCLALSNSLEAARSKIGAIARTPSIVDAEGSSGSGGGGGGGGRDDGKGGGGGGGGSGSGSGSGAGAGAGSGESHRLLQAQITISQLQEELQELHQAQEGGESGGERALLEGQVRQLAAELKEVLHHNEALSLHLHSQSASDSEGLGALATKCSQLESHLHSLSLQLDDERAAHLSAMQSVHELKEAEEGWVTTVAELEAEVERQREKVEEARKEVEEVRRDGEAQRKRAEELGERVEEYREAEGEFHRSAEEVEARLTAEQEQRMAAEEEKKRAGEEVEKERRRREEVEEELRELHECLLESEREAEAAREREEGREGERKEEGGRAEESERRAKEAEAVVERLQEERGREEEERKHVVRALEKMVREVRGQREELESVEKGIREGCARLREEVLLGGEKLEEAEREAEALRRRVEGGKKEGEEARERMGKELREAEARVQEAESEREEAREREKELQALERKLEEGGREVERAREEREREQEERAAVGRRCVAAMQTLAESVGLKRAEIALEQAGEEGGKDVGAVVEGCAEMVRRKLEEVLSGDAETEAGGDDEEGGQADEEERKGDGKKDEGEEEEGEESVAPAPTLVRRMIEEGRASREERKRLRGEVLRLGAQVLALKKDEGGQGGEGGREEWEREREELQRQVQESEEAKRHAEQCLRQHLEQGEAASATVGELERLLLLAMQEGGGGRKAEKENEEGNTGKEGGGGEGGAAAERLKEMEEELQRWRGRAETEQLTLERALEDRDRVLAEKETAELLARAARREAASLRIGGFFDPSSPLVTQVAHLCNVAIPDACQALNHLSLANNTPSWSLAPAPNSRVRAGGDADLALLGGGRGSEGGATPVLKSRGSVGGGGSPAVVEGAVRLLGDMGSSGRTLADKAYKLATGGPPPTRAASSPLAGGAPSTPSRRASGLAGNVQAQWAARTST